MQNHEVSVKKNVVLNVLKQTCAIVFPFLTFSYASHILGAEKTGIYTFGQSIVSYFFYLAMLGIPDYAVREIAAVRDDETRLEKLANELFMIQLLSSLFSYIILFFVLGIWEKSYLYQNVILILSSQIALTAVGADWVNTAFEDFTYLTVRYLVTASVCTAAIFQFVKGPEDLYCYTLFSVLCTAGGNLWNIFYIRRYVRLRPTMHLELKKHLPRMLLFFLNSMALVVYLNSDITLLGMIAGDTAVGIYSVPAKIYMVTKAMVNAVIMSVVPGLSHIIAEKGKKDTVRMLSETADLLCLLLIPAALGIFLEAENIIYFVAGSSYLGGAAVLRIYSVTILFAVAACFFSYAVLVPFHLEKYFLLSTVLAAGLNIGLNFWLIPHLGMNGAALTTLLAEIMVAFVSFYFVRKAAGVRLSIGKKDICTELAGGLAIVIVCFAVRQPGFSRIVELGVSIALAAAIYASILLGMKNKTFLVFLQSVWKRR